MMRPSECPHEAAVLDVVVDGLWPEGADTALRAHVDGCDVCRDLADVACLLRDDRQSLLTDLAVPPSGAVWWRARVRARAEAERTTMQPMLMAAACSVTVLVAVVAALVAMGWPWGSEVLGDGVHVLRRLQPSWRVSVDATTLLPWLLERWLVPTVLACCLLVATPVALYVAARD